MTHRPPGRIIRSNALFRKKYHALKNGDCIIGRLNLKNSEESLFLDLVERGILLIPSALSQQLSRSKCMQALVYERFMLPGTTVVRSRHELVACIERFGRAGTEKVITKQDRLDCGLGINCWDTVEEVYNAVCFGNLEFPFVMQPLVSDATDIRVIIIGDYIEAYWRKSRVSFRNNLHFGGESGQYSLSPEQVDMCRKVMTRGKFPYAHIDLLLTQEDSFFLSEISLRGGIRGARITPAEYRDRIDAVHKQMVRDIIPNP